VKILEQSQRVLETYRVDKGLVQEHANGERRITQGGYGDRQLFELVQNAADEIAGKPGGTVHVVLTETHLYCANEGSPVTSEGAETILRMSVSRKRGGQIGRFGVGVKSVLAVTDAPEFFSTSGSFGFDRDWSRGEIFKAVGMAPDPAFEAPVLRMARPLDEAAARAADPELDELLTWATTVVRLPLLPGAAARLGNDIHLTAADRNREQEEFPTLFQLFSPHVGTVVLEDRRIGNGRSKVRRVLTTEKHGHHHVINEQRTGSKPSSQRWKVFSVTHSPTEQARSSAGEMHDRGTIDIAWAVPEYSGNAPFAAPFTGRGKFWSFFPTKYEMTLSGALNGAWKTNEDRQNLLDSNAFNRELIQVAARLVVHSLPRLAPPEDPGAYLPLLPGRPRESETVSWADLLLTQNVWALTALLPSLPDQDGVLRVPGELRFHPDDGKNSARALKPEWLRMWSACPGRPSNWLHPSVEATSLRSGKVEHILRETKVERAGVREWLEALVSDGTAEASAVAIRIFADMVATNSGFVDEARKADFVLTESGDMVPPVPNNVWRRTVQDGLKDDLVYVDPKLSEDPGLLGALTAIGIREADDRGRFAGVLDQGFDSYGPRDWARFWELFRRAGGRGVTTEVYARAPQPLGTLFVRTLDGAFHRMSDCLLPGAVVPADGSRDDSIAVDLGFHADDTDVLREFGLRPAPVTGDRPEAEDWFPGYRQAQYDAYCADLGPTETRPQIARMKLSGSAVSKSLHLLPRLSDEGRAALVKALPDAQVVSSWTLQFGAQTQTHRTVESPLRWMVRTQGKVNTSQGLKNLPEAVGPQLAAYRDVLPVADISPEKARKLGVPTTVDAVPARQWHQLLTELLHREDDAFVGNTYVLLTRLEVPFPEGSLTRCRVGDEWSTREDGEIAVAASASEYRDLRAEKLPALLTRSQADADLLIDTWGMLRYSEVVTKEIRFVPEGEETPLRDAFPALRALRGSAINGYSALSCVELEHVTRTPTGMKAVTVNSALQGNTVLVLSPESPLETLIAVDRELHWNMGEKGCRNVLAEQERQEHDRKIQSGLQSVRDAATVVEKLALLLGADALRERLPAGLLESEEQAPDGGEPSAERIAQMAYNSHGDGVLQVHVKDLLATYPNFAPTSFTGANTAVRFVSDLGFPDSFAGTRAPTREPRIEVDGPSEFPRLHDYQERLAANVFAMLDRVSPQRGMLSLPTGAGKTRVASEAVIRWIKQDGDIGGPVLWIAQSEELCEQAVQSWKFVWSKVGAETPLVISRLWGSNEAGSVEGRPHLVVATDAKLRSCLDTDEYAWLRVPALVIVDEAHVAIAPQYTAILSSLGITAARTERHLLGLTATPFRNTNEEETQRLVRRFGGRRLDEGVLGPDPYAELQRLDMLARVEHRELTGGTLELTANEVVQAQQLSVLSKAAEQRLAEDHDRNNRIIAEIADMDPDWPVLVFATSVAHAKFLAAKLNDLRISAASVDSATSDQDRHKRVTDFRRKRLRVLTNYGVLSQGFDAPATRAVVVARPTYSPNVYQQMIGRGLRGPNNGGKETCLILNVRDNITNYGKALAFTQFEHLWSSK
jgi:superfamily II DNA or RNA helicase